MTVLAPFDRHPAKPETLTSCGGSLATQATQGLTLLDGDTRQAYAPVLTHWEGIGAAEARQSPRRVSTDAARVGGRVSAAAVALACWARCVQDFNAEVGRIVDTVYTAGTGRAAAGLTDEEIAEVRSQARHDGEIRWHTAYDTHIVDGRTEVGRILREGPGTRLVLDLFQAGLLPMTVINLYPGIDFGRLDWRALFANLRDRGVDPAQWVGAGSYDPAVLRARLDLLRELGVPPGQYADLLRAYWVAVAAEHAGIDLAAWIPARGAGELSDIIQAVYTYYGNLYLDHPYLQWAGMANLVGPSFAAGFLDLHLFREVAQTLQGKPGVPLDLSVLANASAAELRFFETTFLQMQQDIFFDQAMMHEAYLAGGMDAITELREAGLIDLGTELAWQQIDQGRATGDQELIERGNQHLLLREQRDIIQDSYTRMYDRPVTGPAFTYLMTAVGEPSVPGAQSFPDYRPLTVVTESPGPEEVPLLGWDNPLQVEVEVTTPLPDGNLADFEDRWTYITEDTLPAYQGLLREDPAQAREIISSDVGDRIDDYRLHHRIDSLLWHYATDWGLDVDQ